MPGAPDVPVNAMHTPRKIDLKKDRGLAIEWDDGQGSYFSIAYLRRMSPSADMRELRKAIDHNPLTVLPGGGSSGPIVATGAELVGNYAIRISFSDGHDTGIYTWEYLRSLDPEQQNPSGKAPGDHTPPHADPLGLGR